MSLNYQTVVGIDPGFRHTAFVSLSIKEVNNKIGEVKLNNSGLICIEKSKIKPKIILPEKIREYRYIFDNLQKIELNIGSLVGIEFYQPRGAYDVCTVRGMLLDQLFDSKCIVVPLAPQTVKICVCNNRKAKKLDIENWACKNIIDFKEALSKVRSEYREHICDSAAIAYTAYVKTIIR